MAGEFDFISWIRTQQPSSALVPLAAGDDLAIVNWPADLMLVGVDQVLDGVHFDSARHGPRDIGRKAMNRNLSDCAAMACVPVAAVASVALPRDRGIDYAKQLYLGLRSAADAFDCQIIGGDTGSWDGRLVVTVTILGRADGIEPVRRSGAKVGDTVHVTGPLGGSILGRHMNFTPRIQWARQLARELPITAMIDLSDGLSRDLGHIARASGVGAVIDAAAVPVHEDAIELRRDGISPLDHALHDGEDYELLFTAAPNHSTMLQIGRIIEEPGLWLQQPDATRIPLDPGGWEHTL
jgi:thiamine-monophosphate kinase